MSLSVKGRARTLLPPRDVRRRRGLFRCSARELCAAPASLGCCSWRWVVAFRLPLDSCLVLRCLRKPARRARPVASPVVWRGQATGLHRQGLEAAPGGWETSLTPCHSGPGPSLLNRTLARLRTPGHAPALRGLHFQADRVLPPNVGGGGIPSPDICLPQLLLLSVTQLRHCHLLTPSPAPQPWVPFSVQKRTVDVYFIGAVSTILCCIMVLSRCGPSSSRSREYLFISTVCILPWNL